MEGPASTLCLRTRYIKDCKQLGITANPPELGPPPLSRSCSCSRRIARQEWSNSGSKCALPIIPEYPGFQDVKLSKSYLGNPALNQMCQDLEGGKNSSSQLNNFPRRGSLPHCLGSCCCLKGHQPTSPGFQDKPLQEYFNERLMQLGSYGSQRCKPRKTKGFAEKSPSPFRGSRRGSSGNTTLGMGCGREGEEPCSSANLPCNRGLQCKGQKDIQNILKLYSGEFLDLLMLHITAPLEASVQK